MNEPQYVELHVVSDLHMGGESDFQILRESRRLAGFVRWVAARQPQAEVALVLNGDVIDTLAEKTAGYIAVDDGVAVVERIMADPSFSVVWDALAFFVAHERRSLIIVIGNHDIEMALPAVQRAIRLRLAGSDPAANGRIEFSTAGAGFTCSIGSARVFCIHGNEVDDWNLVDYRQLSTVARDQNAGRPFDARDWQANAGTMMVKDIMNAVKGKFAWIDLLKPETKGAVGVLAVVDPSQASKLASAIPILREKVVGTLKLHGLLSADESAVQDAQAAQAMALDQMLGANLLEGVGGTAPGVGHRADEMLLQTERALGKPPQVSANPDGTLGWGQLIWDRLTGVDKPEALRRALLDWRADDRATFAVHDRDDTCKAVLEQVGGSVDVIITGHTHLERAIDLGGGRAYFNCGTWIRLLRFTDAMLANSDSFKSVYEVLINGSMKAIDAAIFSDKPFVLDQTSAVSVRLDGEHVVAELAHVEGDGSAAPTVVETFRR